jgi:hypothetical protein
MSIFLSAGDVRRPIDPQPIDLRPIDAPAPLPVPTYLAQQPGAGFWIFTWGGLINSSLAEPDGRAHIVNTPDCAGSATLCGRSRFAAGDPGGCWRPPHPPIAPGGWSKPGDQAPVCPDCAARAAELVAA